MGKKKKPASFWPQPGRQVGEGADPFAGVDKIRRALDALIGRTEIGEGTKDDIIKKTGASTGMETPVCDQGLDEFPVNPAAGIVHQLFEF